MDPKGSAFGGLGPRRADQGGSAPRLALPHSTTPGVHQSLTMAANPIAGDTLPTVTDPILLFLTLDVLALLLLGAVATTLPTTARGLPITLFGGLGLLLCLPPLLTGTAATALSLPI